MIRTCYSAPLATHDKQLIFRSQHHTDRQTVSHTDKHTQFKYFKQQLVSILH
uniref:Uncharacterized protein n=1 Tax=Anguilla anguilla TaxID=7936 RepID=A0A0E9S6N3_ANGAN